MSCPCCIRSFNNLLGPLFPNAQTSKNRRAFHHSSSLGLHPSRRNPTPISASLGDRDSFSNSEAPGTRTLRSEPPATPDTFQPQPTVPIDESTTQMFTIRRLLELINDATKWWVSGVAFLVLVTRHDEYIAWALTGSIVAAFNNKLLKKLINQARPENARKADPGMPSSHAQSLAFLMTYAIIGVRSIDGLPDAAMNLSSVAVGMLGTFLAYLRVKLGYHTADQVVVGFGVGVGSASLWHYLGVNYAFPAMFQNEGLAIYLYGVTALAVVVFAGKTVLGWFKEKAYRKELEAKKGN